MCNHGAIEEVPSSDPTYGATYRQCKLCGLWGPALEAELNGPNL